MQQPLHVEVSGLTGNDCARKNRMQGTWEGHRSIERHGRVEHGPVEVPTFLFVLGQKLAERPSWLEKGSH